MIDTVVIKQVKVTIDDIYNLIENKDDVSELYNFINSSKNNSTILDINKLFNLPIKIYPIVDNFLRYNSNSILNIKDTDKDTRAKLIVEKSVNVEKIYTLESNKDVLLRLFDHNLDRKSVKVNFLIQKSVIDRIYKVDTNEINNPYFPLLNKYDSYCYQNFEKVDNDNFLLSNITETIVGIRYSNIVQLENAGNLYLPIEYFSITSEDEVNVVGFLFSNKNISDIRLKNIKKIKLDNNVYKSIITFFENYYKKDESYYLIFDINKIYKGGSDFESNTQKLINFSKNFIKILLNVCFNKFN